MTDSKEWVTTKVPKDDRDTAKDLKPEDATWGDCLVAGARALAQETNEVYKLDGRALSEGLDDDYSVKSLDQIERELDASMGDIDPDAIAHAVSQQIDYAHIADSVADELEGRMR